MLSKGGAPRQSATVTIILAIIATLFFGTLLFVFGRDALWILIIILPPIWIPAVMPFVSDPDDDERQTRFLIGSVVIGALVVFVFAVLVFLAS